MRKIDKPTAFSLIELSVVLIIIGILIAGVIQSSKLYAKFKLKTAQTLTKSSPVHGVKDLIIWYETSLDESFISNEATNGLPVSTWYNINTQKISKSNATQSTPGIQPLYKENKINGLPTLSFDGVDDYLNLDGSVVIGTNYTVFIVGQRTTNDQFNYFIAGDNFSGEGLNLAIGWRLDTTVWLYNGTGTGVSSYITPNYKKPTPTIITAWFSKTGGKKLWSDGGLTPDGSSAITTPISAYTGASIGRGVSRIAHIEISELIIFQRALNTEERQSIEAYLGQKYNITIS
jgi:prepilin-type N-terminal cleavage/methylation domain-containing protein